MKIRQNKSFCKLTLQIYYLPIEITTPTSHSLHGSTYQCSSLWSETHVCLKLSGICLPMHPGSWVTILGWGHACHMIKVVN